MDKMPNMLTPKEISKILNLSYGLTLEFIKYSGIEYIQIGRQYRVSEEKLNAFLNQKGKVYVNLDAPISK